MSGNDITLAEVHAELQTISRLLVLDLVRNGLKQKDLAAVLGVSDATLSKSFPKGLLKGIADMEQR